MDSAADSHLPLSTVPGPPLPRPRGRLSSALTEALRAEPGDVDLPREPDVADAIADEDLQLSLYVLYELHYRGFEGVDPAWEWEPSLLSARAPLERRFEAALRRHAAPGREVGPEQVGAELFRLAEEDPAPSLSRYLETQGTREQFREFVIQRSAYQLKEADPHSWAIPRLHGAPKAAMVEIQADEYGGGRPDRVHAVLFAKAMRALGLDDSYGADLDRIPGQTLAGVNLISMCGLHRRLRAALVGHLAMFEISSAVPNGRYANGLRRLGLDSADALDFYEEHVEADSVHENIAAYDLAQGLARQQPELATEVIFGARALLETEGRLASSLLEAWQRGESSLLDPAAPLVIASGA